jgi:hypothetical protein
VAATGHHNMMQAKQKVGSRKKHGDLLANSNYCFVVNLGLARLYAGLFFMD